MAILTQTRKRFRTAALVLGSVILLSVLYLLLPVGGETEQKSQELLEKQNTTKMLEAQVRPLSSMPQLLTQSQKQIGDFYEKRLPSRYSTVLAELGRLASQNGVRVAGVDYETSDVQRVPGLRAVIMKASVGGRYQNLARFINALERNQKVFFLIRTVQLGGEQQGGVDLAIQVETYLRPTTPADFRATRRGEAAEPEAD